MLRIKDFYAKKVYDINGNRLGLINDLCVDFYNSKLSGIFISRKSLFTKQNYIKYENIVSIGEEFIVSNVELGQGLKLKEIIGLDVMNINGNMRGVVEDIIIDRESFYIKGLIVSTGLIDRIINGKYVILPKECVLGEEFIIYLEDKSIFFKTMPKRLNADG